MDVCRRQGAETEALRNEAEIGAALCHAGRPDEGLALMDSVISVLSGSPSFRFNELDALIIVLRRKISALASQGRQTETLPLARRVIALLDDYERNPDRYHDGSYREPPAEKRDDYIRFYRAQAENFVASAYAALGQTGDMKATFERLENIVREADTREHQARYRALEQQMERQTAEARSRQMTIIAIASVVGLLLVLLFAVYVFAKNRIISMKNRVLVRLIDEAIKYKERYEQLLQPVPSPPTAGDGLRTLPPGDLFQYLCADIRQRQLYLAPQFDRQAICERYGLSAAQVGNAFAQGSDYGSVADFVRDCRLEHACRLLTTTDMKVADVAASSGFSRATTFNHDFKARFNLSPSEYRRR